MRVRKPKSFFIPLALEVRFGEAEDKFPRGACLPGRQTDKSRPRAGSRAAVHVLAAIVPCACLRVEGQSPRSM